jgi:hypothetical protein
MAKVDRLGWTAGIAFTSFGVRVGVRTNSPDGLDRLVKCFPPNWNLSRNIRVNRLYSLLVGGQGPRPGVRRFNLLYANSARIARSTDLDEVFGVFESSLQLHIAEMARHRVFVHAGVVGWRGHAIIVPGRSFSGKSSLVAELVRSGATYYSDEYAVLDSQGRVHPFERPLVLRNQDRPRQSDSPVESLGGPRGLKPLPVGLVVVTRYKPGARWQPRRLSAGQGALALLDNTVSIQRRPEAALDAVQMMVSRATVLKSLRGEAKDTVGQLLKAIGS